MKSENSESKQFVVVTSNKTKRARYDEALADVTELVDIKVITDVKTLREYLKKNYPDLTEHYRRLITKDPKFTIIPLKPLKIDEDDPQECPGDDKVLTAIYLKIENWSIASADDINDYLNPLDISPSGKTRLFFKAMAKLDSRTPKKKYSKVTPEVISMIKELINDNPGIAGTQLTMMLKEKGYRIGQSHVYNIMKGFVPTRSKKVVIKPTKPAKVPVFKYPTEVGVSLSKKVVRLRQVIDAGVTEPAHLAASLELLGHKLGKSKIDRLIKLASDDAFVAKCGHSCKDFDVDYFVALMRPDIIQRKMPCDNMITCCERAYNHDDKEDGKFTFGGIWDKYAEVTIKFPWDTLDEHTKDVFKYCICAYATYMKKL